MIHSLLTTLQFLCILASLHVLRNEVYVSMSTPMWRQILRRICHIPHPLRWHCSCFLCRDLSVNITVTSLTVARDSVYIKQKQKFTRRRLHFSKGWLGPNLPQVFRLLYPPDTSSAVVYMHMLVKSKHIFRTSQTRLLGFRSTFPTWISTNQLKLISSFTSWILQLC